MKDKLNLSNTKKTVIVLCLLLLFVLVFFISLRTGSNNYTLQEVFNAIFVNRKGMVHTIVFNVRLPRVIIACLVGICLSLAGCILQGVMRNSMASPSTIGVTSGASFAGYLTLVAFPAYASLLPVGAFIGALCTTLFIYALAYREGISPVKMILSGLAISALLGAFNDMIKLFFSENVSGATGFLVGGLSGVTWEGLKMILPYACVGVLASLFLPNKMNILMLGDEVANSLGLNTEALRLLLIIIASLLSAAAVSVAGMISFVGLIVPHIARLLVGSDYKYLFPASIILGALMVLACDSIGRIIILPAEMPVGVILSVIGAPFFLYLLRRKHKEEA